MIEYAEAQEVDPDEAEESYYDEEDDAQDAAGTTTVDQEDAPTSLSK